MKKKCKTKKLYKNLYEERSKGIVYRTLLYFMFKNCKNKKFSIIKLTIDNLYYKI